MSVHWVPITADNLHHCVPLWNDRAAYSPAEFDVALSTLRVLLQTRQAVGGMMLEGNSVRGFGIGAYAHEAAVERLLHAPYPQFGKHLLLGTEPTRGRHALLDRSGIGVRNAGPGLQVVTINSSYDPQSGDLPAVLGCMVDSFQAVHKGQRLARVTVEAYGPAAELIRNSLSFSVRAVFNHVGGVTGLAGALATATRDRALETRDMLMSMFVYSPPRIRFTESEQNLLRAALSGGPDETLAIKVGVPLTAVKARWTRLLARASAAVPDLFADLPAARRMSGRGAQCRHVLLEYVRQHPAELTPYFSDVPTSRTTQAPEAGTHHTPTVLGERRSSRRTPDGVRPTMR
jgi:hypothetical protein